MVGSTLLVLLKAGFIWLMRRGAIFYFSAMYLATVPMQMWVSVADHRDGVGYFSDPIAKPSLFAYWQTLSDLSYTLIFTRSKPPTEEGLAALMNSPTPSLWEPDGVSVLENSNYYEFVPPESTPSGGGKKGKPLVGIIILPGAYVSPVAYAPLARTMAQMGHPSFIVRFDFNIAYYGWERIGEIMEQSEQQDLEDGKCSVTPAKWVLVGHSLGTLAIEKFYPENVEKVDGVVYLGSGNRIGDAMAGADVPALVLRGSRDSFVPAEALKRSAPRLPKNAEIKIVEGGNHRGFASYTWQPLDWEATITLQEQRGIVVDALTSFIKRKVKK